MSQPGLAIQEHLYLALEQIDIGVQQLLWRAHRHQPGQALRPCLHDLLSQLEDLAPESLVAQRQSGVGLRDGCHTRGCVLYSPGHVGERECAEIGWPLGHLGRGADAALNRSRAVAATRCGTSVLTRTTLLMLSPASRVLIEPLGGARKPDLNEFWPDLKYRNL